MRQTYITKMPDKAGAFLVASKIISGEGGNIVRVNYNKAIDLHTLFIEVSASEEQHKHIAERLAEQGYLTDDHDGKQIIMIVLKLPDVAGAVLPILEIIRNYKVNISYISSQENGTPYQYFKMGLLIENTDEIRHLLYDLSGLCEVKILEYEVTDRFLDGTVFYLTFAGEMREILNLSQEVTNTVLIQANKLMQILDERRESPLKTFDYIRRFAKFVADRKDENFSAKVSSKKIAEDLTLYVIEPPCGSNTYILEHGSALMFVDCGFACFEKGMRALFDKLFGDFSARDKSILITHADIDHTGLLHLFDKAYMSRNCYDNFAAENRGEANFREQNPLHAPYCVLSKIISDYTPPPLEHCVVIGERTDDEPLSYIGSLSFGGRNFEFYEGNGGHVKGETVIVCRELKLVFTGDIYVNIKGFTDEQREFNLLAPYLMTGVDIHPSLCKECRELLLKRYEGYTVCPGHGPIIG